MHTYFGWTAKYSAPAGTGPSNQTVVFLLKSSHLFEIFIKNSQHFQIQNHLNKYAHRYS